MRVNITTKNYNASAYLRETIEKKFKKLGKYFSDDIVANVTLSREGNNDKMEATINAKGTIFRAEERAEHAYDCIEKVVDKLSSQMSKFKTKLQKKFKDNKDFNFAELPESKDEAPQVVRVKKFTLTPMTVEEAIMQMELLQHSFFMFLNMDNQQVNVVYKRSAEDYGLLQPEY